MCGIAGLGGDLARDAGPVVASMVAAMAHRGPDDRSTVEAARPAAVLGTARLAVLDRSAAGRQPMTSPDGAVVLAYNGEVYNYRGLRGELERRGPAFASDCDTEVVLRALHAWGSDALPRLDGMFALAVADARTSTILLARDRVGEKPLYYWVEPSGRGIAFASELRALLRCARVPAAVDEAGLAAYLALGYVPSPATMLAGVRKLRPGHALVWDGDGAAERPFWSAGDFLPPRRRARAAEVRDLVQRAVASRLVSDVPVGVLLSGGLDSSIVATVMAAQGRGTVRTFSTAYEAGARGVKYNADAEAAGEVAAALGTDHTTLTIAMDGSLPGHVEAAVLAMDEPFANPTVVATHMLARRVGEAGVTVVLTGDGSDELFGGYERYRAARYTGWLRRVPSPARDVAARLGPAALGAAAARLRMDPAAEYASWWELFAPRERRDLAGAAVPPGAFVPSHAVEAASRAPDRATRLAVMDLLSWLPDESNARVDRMTMAGSIEARAPFLDRDVVEYALGCSMSSKVGAAAFEAKRVLRAAFAGRVPAAAARRRKWAWLPPYHYWVRGVLWDACSAAVRDLAANGPVGPAALRYLASRPESEPAKVWALAVLGMWHDSVVRRRAA